MAPRNRIAADVSREKYNPVLIEDDLKRIVEEEGFLSRNHLLDGSHILRAFNVYLAERVKPETIEALNHCHSSYYLAFNAYNERARYERKLRRNNTTNTTNTTNREAKPAESTIND